MTMKTMSKPLIIAAAATAVASGVGGYLWHEQKRPPLLEIYVFALKSGRSMFIRTPDDRRILIDGGTTAEIIRHLTSFIPFYSRRIDMVIATNTDSKNISGLIDIVDRYDVDQVYVPAFTLENLGVASSMDKVYQTFMAAVTAKKVALHEVAAGDLLSLSGDDMPPKAFPGVTASVLFPVPPDRFEYSRASSPEILMKISYGANSIIFLGDASKKVQKFIASSESLGTTHISKDPTDPDTSDITDTDVLVVSHSASPDMMSGELISLVQPGTLIYEKAVTKAPPKRTKTPSKPPKGSTSQKRKFPVDPFAGVLAEDRFNVREVGTVKIVTDGTSLSVTGESAPSSEQKIP